MSANTGLPPASTTELAVAAKVNDGTITSSPDFLPAARNAMCNAEVPEFTAMLCRRCTNSENSDSNAATSGPPAIIPDRSTRSTASRSSSPMIGFAAGIISVMMSPQ